MNIKYAIPPGGCRVDITVDFSDVCISGKVVITVFRLDVAKILDDVCMTFGDVVISLGKVVVDVNIISGDDALKFCDVSGLSGSVVLTISSVVMFVSPVVILCFVVNLAGEVTICVVELSCIFDVILIVEEERYFKFAVVLSDVIVVPGKVVWVT